MGDETRERRDGDAADVVERAYLAVLGATDPDLETAVDLGASALAAEPSGWGEVSRALLALTDQVLRGCWARGWQPADVVRMVRRGTGPAQGLGPEHVRLAKDLIAAENRTHRTRNGDRGDRGGRTDHPDPRWAAQLAELEASVRWDGDDTFLDAYGRRERLDRFSTATAVLELLRLLGRLPRITALTAPAAPRREPPMLGRIRALLAKAESTGFPEEAEALTAKAQHLMARHSIDEALLEGAEGHGTPHGPGACRIGVDQPYEGAKALLLDAVAAANRCQAVWAGEFGFSTVVGFEADLEAVELLYTSLLVQAHTAMQRGGSRSKHFRQSFLIAYAGRIRERLAAAAEDAAREAAAEPDVPGERLLPVLAAREVAVRETTERMFPETTTHRLKGRDAEGWRHGTEAADRAVLDRARTSPSGD